jgi:hypothetical protein
MKLLRALAVTAAISSVAFAMTVAPASAGVHTSCATAQTREVALQARLAKVQQHINASNAKLTAAGTDQTRIAKLQARVTREQVHHDRIAARLAALTQRCQS